jgi:HEAT repeat protein
MSDDFPDDLRPAIDALLQGTDWVKARDAAVTLGASGDVRVVPALCRALAIPPHLTMNGYWTVREEAARALARLGDPRAVEPLCALLDDWAAVAAIAAADALGTFRDGRAVEPLCLALQSNHIEVGAPAARALGKIGDARAVQPLLVSLQSTFGPRQAAAEALAVIGDRSSVQDLCHLLTANDEFLRRVVADTLGKLGDLEALPVLKARLKFFGGERRRSVRRALRAAIKAINAR